MDPAAKRARPDIARRGLRLCVLRLLAFNAEAWLAEHFNAYLTDPNEYRAIARNLLHVGGHVDYTTTARYSKGPTDGYPTPAVADHQSQHSRFRHSVRAAGRLLPEA